MIEWMDRVHRRYNRMVINEMKETTKDLRKLLQEMTKQSQERLARAKARDNDEKSS